MIRKYRLSVRTTKLDSVFELRAGRTNYFMLVIKRSNRKWIFSKMASFYYLRSADKVRRPFVFLFCFLLKARFPTLKSDFNLHWLIFCFMSKCWTFVVSANTFVRREKKNTLIERKFLFCLFSIFKVCPTSSKCWQTFMLKTYTLQPLYIMDAFRCVFGSAEFEDMLLRLWGNLP